MNTRYKIADSYREVEQCSDGYRNENPCVPVPIAIGTIPGGTTIKKKY